MNRETFNRLFAATKDTWFEPRTLNRLNNLAYRYLKAYDADDRNIEQIVKAAFDYAANQL